MGVWVGLWVRFGVWVWPGVGVRVSFGLISDCFSALKKNDSVLSLYF